MNLMQGNTYRLPIKLKMCGRYLSADEVLRVEFTIGEVVKHFPEEVTYEDGRFILPLSQEETFSLGGMTRYQVRALFFDGSVKSSQVLVTNVKRSISEEVLCHEG